MQRRDFLHLTSASALAASALAAPAPAPGSAPAPSPSALPRLRLGIDWYCLRSQNWKSAQIIDYAASVGADLVQVGPRDFTSQDTAHLREMVAYGRSRGVELEAGLGCIGPLSKRWSSSRADTPRQYLQECLRYAQAIETRVIKVYMGNSEDRFSGVPMTDQIHATVQGLRTIRAEALDLGIVFAVETHGDLLARECREIIERAGPDFVGCNLDTGNPVRLGEDPLLALEILGPYVHATHLRDSVIFEHPRGAAWQSMPLGQGHIDYHAFTASFRQLCPRSAFTLEILTGGPPSIIPFLEPAYWTHFPAQLASDFARFLALARRGQPNFSPMLVARGADAPPEYKAALVQQERLHLEQSLAFARSQLRVGLRPLPA